MESANVVGYQSYDASATDDMATIGVAFSNVGAVGGAYTITDTIFGRTVEDGDQILLWDNTAYNLINYTYYDGAGWGLTDAYGDDQGFVASITVEKGQVLWYVPSDPTTGVTVSGEVAASGTQTLTFDINDSDCFAFVNPFPKDTLFSEITAFCEDGDQLILWDNTAYNLINYTFYDGAGWGITDGYGDDQGFANESDVAIPAGAGAYFVPADSREWTVTFNY
ncbi:MAG: hypothetical protein IKR71_02320 [Bacteroidales bacterium]|nr:hypothetical protein [Bacteroidales bacterium]